VGKQPARPEARAAGGRDAGPQLPVGGHDFYGGAVRDLSGDLVDDGIVTVAVRMLDAEPLLVSFGAPASRGTLEDKDYLVVRQVRCLERFGQAASRAGRSRHQPSGRLPTTFAPSTTRICTSPPQVGRVAEPSPGP
jgi:hypothetical protein